MSSFHSSFGYLGKRSDLDFEWVIASFDGNDGESDSFLSGDIVSTPNYNGTFNQVYGFRYDTTITPTITVIKSDQSDFTVAENRMALKWLTGSQQSSWLDFYLNNTVVYRLLGNVKDVKQYKMNGRIIGLTIEFESVAPWAFSPLQSVVETVNGSTNISIPNQTDDLYTYIYPTVVFENTPTNGTLTISNTTTGDTGDLATLVTGLTGAETVTMSNNMMITSSNTAKTFGNDFNYVFPRLTYGTNQLTVDGEGIISFEYMYPIKIGDMAIEINNARPGICEGLPTAPVTEVGFWTERELDMITERLSVDSTFTDTVKPEITATKAGHTATFYVDGVPVAEIDDAINVDSYTKTEDNTLLATKANACDVYTKTEADNMLTSKSDCTHTHVSDSALSSTSTNSVQNKVVNAAINNLNILVGSTAVSTQINTAKNSTLASAKSYTDSEISDLINGAPTTLDTLGEIATAMEENADVVEALNTAVGTKAKASDLTAHTSNKSNPHNVTLSQLGVTSTAAELNALDGITASVTELNYTDGVTSNIQTQINGKAAAVHSHAISGVNGLQTALDNKVNNDSFSTHVDDTTIHITSTERTNLNDANSKKHTHSNKSVLDSTTQAFTGHQDISGKADTSYVNTEIAKKANTSHTHSIANVTNLQTTLDGKAGTSHNHTKSQITDFPSEATTSTSGLMSASDKTKLNGIASGANSYSLPQAGSSLGGVKSGGDVSIASGIISINDDSHNHIISNVDGLQSALDGKSASTHSHDDKYYTESEISNMLSNKADLDDGKIPSSQLPSYVDDVLEVSTFSQLPGTGESGKIYITQDTNLSYRWTGSGYSEISPSIALGETSSTAYRGDRGKLAYDHISDTVKHITSTERNTWNSKANASHTHTKTQITDFAHNHNDIYYTESETNTLLGGKQNTLVSGTTIKTINNQSILGEGNITIGDGFSGIEPISGTTIDALS